MSRPIDQIATLSHTEETEQSQILFEIKQQPGRQKQSPKYSKNSPKKRPPDLLSGQLLKSQLEDKKLIAELYRKINVLERALVDKDEMIKQHKAELAQVKVQLRSLQFSSNTQRKEFLDKIHQADNNTTQLTQKTKEIEQLKHEKQEKLEKDIQAIRVQNNQLLTRIQQLQNDHKVKGHLQETELEKVLLEKVIVLNETIQNFTETKKKTQKEKQVKKIQNQNILILEKQIKELKKLLVLTKSQCNETIEHLKKQYEKNVEFRLMKKYQSKINMLAEFKNKISQLQFKVDQSQEELKKKNQQMRQLSYIIHKHQNDILFWESKTEAVEQQNSNLMKKNEKSLKKYLELCQQIQRVQKQFKNNINDLQLINFDLKQELEQEKSKVYILKTTIQNYEGNLRFLNDKIRESSQLIQGLQHQLAQTKNKLEQKQIAIENLDRQLQQIQHSSSIKSKNEQKISTESLRYAKPRAKTVIARTGSSKESDFEQTPSNKK